MEVQLVRKKGEAHRIEALPMYRPTAASDSSQAILENFFFLFIYCIEYHVSFFHSPLRASPAQEQDDLAIRRLSGLSRQNLIAINAIDI